MGKKWSNGMSNNRPGDKRTEEEKAERRKQKIEEEKAKKAAFGMYADSKEAAQEITESNGRTSDPQNQLQEDLFGNLFNPYEERAKNNVDTGENNKEGGERPDQSEEPDPNPDRIGTGQKIIDFLRDQP